MSLSQDPFSAALDVVPKFRDFDISILRGTPSPLETTSEFVSTYKAIQAVHPQDPVVIPNRASFFDFATISPFEEFFPFSKDPAYKDIRNFIVAVYRIFSNRYLPYTLCRRNIKAPAHLTLQIWKFLQKYGLINYQIDEHTRPCSVIPQFDRWPQLIYTSNDKLLTYEQYMKKIHPPAANSYSANDVCLFMKTPYVSPERMPNTAEVPGLMSFGNWTRQEIEALTEALRPQQSQQQGISQQQGLASQQQQQQQQGLISQQQQGLISQQQQQQGLISQQQQNSLQQQQGLSPQQQQQTAGSQWIRIAQKVRTKTPEECAAMVAMMPLPISLEYSTNQIKNLDGSVHPEMTSGDNVLKEMALSKNKDMKIVHRAVHGVGLENSQRLMRREMIGLPKDSNEAASILAMNKIIQNSEKMKNMHKARILECLQKTVSILKQDIQAKRLLIEEARADQSDVRPSESEITSSDEKMWSEQNVD